MPDRIISEEEAIHILKEAFGDDEKGFEMVLAHSRKVQEVALRIAGSMEHVDRDFIRGAALLHDVGRSMAGPGPGSYRHGVLGGEILRDHGLGRYARVAERHLGGGITEEDIVKQKLNLPEKDYLPETVEEKVITFADKLVQGDKEIELAKVVKRFRKEIGKTQSERIQQLHDELLPLVKEESVLGS